MCARDTLTFTAKNSAAGGRNFKWCHPDQYLQRAPLKELTFLMQKFWPLPEKIATL